MRLITENTDLTAVAAAFEGVITEEQVFDVSSDNELIIAEKGLKGYKETLYGFPEDMTYDDAYEISKKLNAFIFPNRTLMECMKIISFATII